MPEQDGAEAASVGPRLADGRRRIRWSHGEAEVQAAAGMLARCRFDLPGGPFEPFAVAPWTVAPGESDGTAALPGHLRHLGAEFVCLPFGCGGALRDPAPAWAGLVGSAVTDPNHGPAANSEWTVAEAAAGSVTLTLDYPRDHAVRRLRRRIAGVPGEPALDLSLMIEARRAGRVPAGLHPILRLPETPGALRIEADFAFGLTYPGRLAPGRMAARPGTRFRSLAAVAGPAGPVDLARLPLAAPTEDVVQLCGVRGPVRARFTDAGATLTIDWDRRLLPSLLVWISDRALQDPPWSGRYRGLGLEPVASAFDLAEETSVRPNPISAAGIATCLALDPERPTVIRYRLSAGPLPA